MVVCGETSVLKLVIMVAEPHFAYFAIRLPLKTGHKETCEDNGRVRLGRMSTLLRHL